MEPIKTRSKYLNLSTNKFENNAGSSSSNGEIKRLISNEDFTNKNGGLIKAGDIQMTH